MEAEVEKAIKRLDSYAGTILAGSGTNEDIHQFRVTYKKLRAFLRLLYTGEDHNNPLKPLKKIYSLSGELRDLQIHLGLISGYFKKAEFHNAVYKGVLEDSIQEATDKLHEAIQGFSFHEFGDKLTKNLPGKPGDDKARQFVHEQAQGFYSNIKEDATDEQLHAARKHLKDIMYNTAYLVAGKEETVLLKSRLELKELATMLGEYHDKCALLMRLEGAQSENLPAEEKVVLAHMARELLYEKGLHREKILKGFKELIAMADKRSGGLQTAGLLLGSATVSALAVFFLSYYGREK